MTRVGARVVGVVVAAASMAVLTVAAEPAVAQQVPAAGAAAQGQQGSGRNYRATRRIVVDRQTGQARMPTRLEVDELVASLATLTHRPETAHESTGAGGAITADLGGGFGGVMLARPNEDGTLETRCVFTFAEGAEFLGLVEVVE